VPIKMAMPGLRDLQATLGRVAPEATRVLSGELKTIGGLVQADTVAEMPRRKGKARRTVKVKVVARKGFEGVQITEGGPAAPYTAWLDFGGKVGKGRRSTARVNVHSGGRVTVHRLGGQGTGSVVRAYLKDGRYLYPSYFRRYQDMVAATLDAVHRAAHAAGLAVTSR
jgi:hypothetical protein